LDLFYDVIEKWTLFDLVTLVYSSLPLL
jgi:hypothetical protein